MQKEKENENEKERQALPILDMSLKLLIQPSSSLILLFWRN
jgi:hypothetical protein